MAYQTAKIQPYTDRQLPKTRSVRVHCDIVGPLPVSKGFVHTIDRFSSWSEAFHVNITTVETVCRVSYDRWVTRFEPPTTASSSNR